VQSLRQKSFPEFCHINGDLEHLAVLGYERMIALGQTIPSSGIIQDTTVMVDAEAYRERRTLA
jgi:hypothetical protein